MGCGTSAPVATDPPYAQPQPRKLSHLSTIIEGSENGSFMAKSQRKDSNEDIKEDFPNDEDTQDDNTIDLADKLEGAAEIAAADGRGSDFAEG